MLDSNSQEEDHLYLIQGQSKIPLAFVDGEDCVYLMSSGNSRWPSAVLRQRTASLEIGKTGIVGSASLVTSDSTRSHAWDRFVEKYGDVNVKKWFDRNSRLIRISLKADGYVDADDPYFLWLREEFESISGDYDRHIYGNRINSYLRERSVERMKKLFPEGSELLEIGCGTGTETISMLKAGYRVTAVDISSGMVEAVKKKAEGLNLSSGLRTEVMRASATGSLLEKYGRASFDGVYSTYGALNCEPDISFMPGVASELLRGGSIIFLGIFNSLCLSESVAHFIGLKFGRVFERFRNPIPEGSSRFCIDVFAYSPMQIRRMFGRHFRYEGSEAVPLILPPSNYIHHLEKITPDPEKLEKLDRGLSKLPILKGLGDHFLMWFRKL